jgi:hypothetical protein
VSRAGRVRTLLELARVSNLPTVWSNVAAGTCLGTLVAGRTPGAGAAVLVALAASLVYVGGMALNDAVDARTDARERPGRPIPSGRISRRTAMTLGLGAIAGGWALTLPLGLAAAVVGLLLAASVVVYNLVHARSAWSVVVMGVCRGLVYVLAAAPLVGEALAQPARSVPVYASAACLAAYTAVLSIVARAETDPGGGRVGGWGLAGLLVAPIAVGVLAGSAWRAEVAALVAAVAAGAWAVWAVRGSSGTRDDRPTRVGPRVRAVLRLIAGFCLIDFAIAAAIVRDWPWVAGPAMGVSAACFVLVLWGHRRILGT